MFEKDAGYYNIIIYNYVSSAGGYLKFKTEFRHTEEEAVKLARKYLADKSIKYKVEIEQVRKVIGWDKGNYCELCGKYIKKEHLKVCDKCASEYKF